MATAKVIDLTFILDAVPQGGKWEYTATLNEGNYEKENHQIKQSLGRPLGAVFGDLRKASSYEDWGAVLFDWAFPPGSRLREDFLDRCAETARRGELLRLWLCIGSRIASDIYFQEFERRAKVSLEGFWVREWAEEGRRPAWVKSPFLALNPWIHLLRRPPGVTIQRHFTVPGRVNVLIVISNPPPGSGKWKHINHLECEDECEKGCGMLLRASRPFSAHRSVGWVAPFRNITKVGIAKIIREHKPYIVIYLGHGYYGQYGCGLVLPVTESGKDFAEVSGLRKFPDVESELEQVMAGKWRALENPGAEDDGLPLQERPRLFIAFACEAAPAAPALLASGVPAVLAMRVRIPDSDGTEEMVRHCVEMIADESKSIEESVSHLRQFLKEKDLHFADERLHFSVPVLHLAIGSNTSGN